MFIFYLVNVTESFLDIMGNKRYNKTKYLFGFFAAMRIRIAGW